MASIAAAPGSSGSLGAALAVVMIVIAAIDARHFVIPSPLVVAALLLGFVAAALDRSVPMTTALLGAASRGAAVALLFFAFRAAYRHIRRREGIGLGDVKLAAVGGVWLSWISLAVAVDVAALSALAFVLIQALRGKHITGTTAVPFGLFFAPAIWIAWLLAVMGPFSIG